LVGGFSFVPLSFTVLQIQSSKAASKLAAALARLRRSQVLEHLLAHVRSKHLSKASLVQADYHKDTFLSWRVMVREVVLSTCELAWRFACCALDGCVGTSLQESLHHLLQDSGQLSRSEQSKPKQQKRQTWL
jgi:hypothetical protein